MVSLPANCAPVYCCSSQQKFPGIFPQNFGFHLLVQCCCKIPLHLSSMNINDVMEFKGSELLFSSSMFRTETLLCTLSTRIRCLEVWNNQLCSSSDRKIRVWNENGKCMKRLRGHS